MAAQVNIFGTIKDLTGLANAGRITFTLSNYSDFVPLADGDVLSPISQTIQAAANGTFSIVLFGNFQVSPINTYYQVQIYAADGTFVSSTSYQLMEAGSFDLSTLQPMFTSLPYPVLPGIIGPMGPPGLSCTNLGSILPWDTLTDYQVGECALFGHPLDVYFATQEASGHEPDTSPDYWLDLGRTATSAKNEIFLSTDPSARFVTFDVLVNDAITKLGSTGGVIFDDITSTPKVWSVNPTWGTAPLTLILSSGLHTLAFTGTIPGNVTIQFLNNAVLQPQAGKTVYLQNAPQADPLQYIFDLSQTGSFVLPKEGVVELGWYLPVTDGSQDVVNILNAVTSVPTTLNNRTLHIAEPCTLLVQSGTWKIVGQLNLTISGHIGGLGSTTDGTVVIGNNAGFFLSQIVADVSTTQIASDDFHHTDGVPPNWGGVALGDYAITSNALTVTAAPGSIPNQIANVSGHYGYGINWTGGGAFTDNQYSSVTFGNVTVTGNLCGPAVQAQGSAGNTSHYRTSYYPSAFAWAIQRWEANKHFTDLIYYPSPAPTTGDVITLAMLDGTLYLIINGIYCTSARDSDGIPLTGGVPGICAGDFLPTGTSFTAWSGGVFNSVTFTPWTLTTSVPDVDTFAGQPPISALALKGRLSYGFSDVSGSAPSPALLPQSITINMTAPSVVGSLYFRPAYFFGRRGQPTKFQIQVSGDGASWTTVVSAGVWANDSSPKSIGWTPTRCQYVRLIATETDGGTNLYLGARQIELSPSQTTYGWGPIILMARCGFCTVQGLTVFTTGLTYRTCFEVSNDVSYLGTTSTNNKYRDLTLRNVSSYAWTGFHIDGGPNQEMFELDRMWVGGNNIRESYGFWGADDNADSTTLTHMNFDGCKHALRLDSGRLRIYNSNLGGCGSSAIFDLPGQHGASVIYLGGGNVTLISECQVNEAGGQFLNINNDTNPGNDNRHQMHIIDSQIGFPDIHPDVYPINWMRGVLILENTSFGSYGGAVHNRTLVGTDSSLVDTPALDGEIILVGSNVISGTGGIDFLCNPTNYASRNVTWGANAGYRVTGPSRLADDVTPPGGIVAGNKNNSGWPLRLPGTAAMPTFQMPVSNWLEFSNTWWNASPALVRDSLKMFLSSDRGSGLNTTLAFVYTPPSGLNPSAAAAFSMPLSGLSTVGVTGPAMYGPFIALNGVHGSTTYSYRLVPLAGYGTGTPSTVATTTSGNAVLDATNNNFVYFLPSGHVGIWGWDIYRVAGGPTQGKIGRVVLPDYYASYQDQIAFTDTGLVADGTSVPSQVTADGRIVAAGALSGADVQVNGVSIVSLKAVHSSLDLASVASGACSAVQTETVAGAVMGNTCEVSSGTALEDGCFFRCAVTATDTVKWQLVNLSGGNVDRASDTYTIRVNR